VIEHWSPFDPMSMMLQLGELQQPEAYAATALLPDGRLWLTGGGAGADMAKAWADSWLITAPPPQA